MDQPRRWEKKTDQFNREYFVNHETRTTQWEAPPNVQFGPDGFEIMDLDKTAPPPAYVAPVQDAPPDYSSHMAPTVASNTYGSQPYPTPAEPQMNPATYGSPTQQYAPAPAPGSTPAAIGAPGLPVAYPASYAPSTQYPPPAGEYPNTYGGYQPPTSQYIPAPAPMPVFDPTAPFIHTPVVSRTGPQKPPEKGFFRRLKDMFKPSSTVLNYPRCVQTTPINTIHVARQNAIDSFYTVPGVTRACNTICELWLMLLFQVLLIIFIALLAFGISKVADGNMGFIGLVAPMAMFVVYLSITYMILFWCQAFTSVEDEYISCGCKNPIYRPYHLANRNTNNNINHFLSQVEQLDNTPPGIYFRVAGYLSYTDYQNSLVHTGVPNYQLYGFTHHFPIVIANAGNISADVNDIKASWFTRDFGRSVVNIKYQYQLRPEDEQWVQRTKNELARLYQGHEGCNFIDVNVVYRLGTYGKETRGFHPAERYGVNYGEHPWADCPVDNNPGQTGLYYNIEHNQSLTRDCCLSDCMAYLGSLLCFYVPLICCFKMCTNETTYIHKKHLEIYHNIAPITYDN